MVAKLEALVALSAVVKAEVRVDPEASRKE